MPTYTYQCIPCMKQFTAQASIKDSDSATCPHCGAVLKKVISAPAFFIK